MELRNSADRALFWDTDPAALDPERHAAYILARTVERGSWEQWTAARSYYGLERIGQILTRTRGLSPRTVAFLTVALGLPRSAFISSRPPASPWPA